MYDANAVANTCTGHLNALTGTRTCDLGCAAGYVSSDIEALACAADGNAAVGARSGGITCTGKANTLRVPLFPALSVNAPVS